MYVPGVKVDSIYSNLKSKGWTAEDVREFIQKIEEKIWALGINIEPTDIKLNSYKPQEEYLSSILKYKPEKSEHSIRHDLIAIEKIQEIRGSKVREIERAKAIFLTSDLKLSNFNYMEMGHKENMTVCEVIPDRLLTNILWLKNPTTIKDIPLKSIIAIHSREILIDKRIWRRFYENVRKLKEDGRIGDKDLSMIFYNRYIEGVLSKLDESDIDKVTPELILEEIENMSRMIDNETQRKLEEQKKIFEKQIAQRELEKEQEWEKKLGEIKESLKVISQKKSNKYINIASLICFFIFNIIIIEIHIHSN